MSKEIDDPKRTSSKYVGLSNLPSRSSSGQSARHALILTLLRCLLPFLINLVSIIVCLNTFVDLSYNLTEVKIKKTKTATKAKTLR